MKPNDGKIVVGYVVFLLAALWVTPLFSGDAAEYYASVAIFAVGGGAIVCQKWLHREKIVDMGFRLNRNAALGLLVGIVFTAFQLGFLFALPAQLGYIRVVPNPEAQAYLNGAPPVVAAVLILLFGGLIMMVPCLFGEELAFRGYLLPRLERRMGTVKAIALNAVIFGLWHCPAYYSIYRGGAAEGGIGPVLVMLVGHGISVIPVCLLYVTTRELYGVSLYHSLVDVFQYSVVGSPELGAAAKDALYRLEIVYATASNVFEWCGQALSIAVMLGLCWLVKRWALPAAPPPALPPALPTAAPEPPSVAVESD